MLSHVESDGPVISLSCGRSGQGLPLRMALYAGVGRVNVVEARRVHDIGGPWLLHVIASGPVTLFAADIPLGHLLGGHVVVDRVASIARGPGGAVHIVFGIIRGPPVCSWLDIVGAPDFVGYVPLRRQGKVIIADLLKVPLLPFAPI